MPRHTAAPPDVIRCSAEDIEIKINQVEFLKLHSADFCQYSALSIGGSDSIRGTVLELRKELHAFFKTEKHERLCEYLQCEFWLSRLEYLAETFAHLNSLNTSMQGREENIFTFSDKLVAFKKKVAIWKNRAKDGNFQILPLVRESCINKSIVINKCISLSNTSHKLFL